MRAAAAVVLLLLGSGCGALRAAQAREQLERGELEQALGVWDRRLADAPDDADALEGRRAVLTLIVDRQVALATQERRAGRLAAALGALGLALDAGARLRQVPPSAAAEQAALEREVRARLGAALAVGQPLAAQALLAELGPSLAPARLDGVGRALRGEVASAGARRCAALGGLARTPWLALLVRRYCTTLGAPGPQVPVAPEQRAALAVDAQRLVSPSGGAAKKLADAALAAFARSPWSDPRARGAVEARVTGTLESRHAESPLDVTVTWQETESYTATEPATESYTETYSTSESYSYSCGSYSSPQTCYGSRQVTHTRPATRTVHKSVTRTRPVTRSLTYPAIQKSAAHRAALRLAVALPGTPEATQLEWTDAYDKQELEHDTTHAAAGLSPHKAQLASPVDWEDRQARLLYEKLAAALRQTWQRSFCRDGEPPPEDAARCLAGGGQPPAAALAAIARFLGEPPGLLQTLAP